MKFARSARMATRKKNGGNGHGGGKPNGKPRTLHERLDVLDGRLDGIEKLLRWQRSDIRNLKVGLAHLRNRLDEHDRRFERIEDYLGIGPPPET